MIQINLIPDVKQELLRAQRTRAIVISSAIVVSIAAGAVVALLAIYIFGVQTVRSVVLDNSIKSGNEKLMKVEDLSKILTIQSQLGKMAQYNDTKKIDSRIFDILSAVTPPEPNNAKYSRVAVSADTSTVRLEGEVKEYASMETLKKTIDSAVFTTFTAPTADAPADTEGTDQATADPIKLASDISISDVSYGENADGQRVVRFALTFTYPDELLSPKVDGINIKFSVNGNVTDSYLGIPRSLFTDRAKDAQ